VTDRWYKQAVVYCLDVQTYQDSNGDGIGDLPGLVARLDHIDRLGATCLWLNPIHPTPNRDDGYDISDFYGVDPAIGTLGDFAELLHQAENRGLRVILDLVVNHTSDQHPWFQAARADPRSPYRDWYVWSDEEPADRREGMVFPGHQKETWTFDEVAGAWYYHRFYDFQPDLNLGNPQVRAEVKKIMAFWLRLGVSGFRMDAAPFVIEQSRPNEPSPPKDFELLTDLCRSAMWRRGDCVILAEANVEKDELVRYFGDGERLPMMFDFLLNQRTFLALARGEAAPIVAALEAAPVIPETSQWATFLRNHDEVDLGRLGDRERQEVFAAFGPEPEMQLYDRGIRRRLAPMLGNDQRRLRMAYALQCSLPGTPVIRYGDEIGMGEDLSLKERNAIRTPMQWTDQPAAAFSTAPRGGYVGQVISGGEFGFETVNVLAHRHDPGSLLRYLERMLEALRQCPEFGSARPTPIDVGERGVLALRYEAPTGVVLALTNLGRRGCTVDASPASTGHAVELFGDDRYDDLDPSLAALRLGGYGHRWIRLAWDIPGGPPVPQAGAGTDGR
jgi:maltose alpha-D-glucosyltransferase/alpha-amylase